MPKLGICECGFCMISEGYAAPSPSPSPIPSPYADTGETGAWWQLRQFRVCMFDCFGIDCDVLPV